MNCGMVLKHHRLVFALVDIAFIFYNINSVSVRFWCTMVRDMRPHDYCNKLFVVKNNILDESRVKICSLEQPITTLPRSLAPPFVGVWVRA